MVDRTRERNNNWKGGRSIASTGYVLIRVGTGHHLADVRGYAYEHRLAAEKKLGRRLAPGEIVHHINGVRDDNRLDNLEVHSSIAEHMHFEHGNPANRAPGAPNPLVECSCRCGASFPKYDASGRPRTWLPGHNPHPASTADGCQRLAASGAVSVADVASALGITRSAARQALSKLSRRGRLVRVRYGVYAAHGSEGHANG